MCSKKLIMYSYVNTHIYDIRFHKQLTTYSQISFIYHNSIGGEPKQLPKERKITLLRKDMIENVNKSLSKIYIILTY